MKRFAVAAVFCLAAPLSAQTDPAAIAGRMQTAMGGDAFASARVLDFVWEVERGGETVVSYAHTWDRWTGDYRVAGTDRESGKPWVAIFDIDTREGRVWLGDEEYPAEAVDEQLERAYGRFINDSYWLLMPWKWLDPGVSLTYAGTEVIGDRLCDVVELAFDGVGLTSNDRYRGYVDRESGRIARWSYVLQNEEGQPGGGDPTSWDWVDWMEVDPGVWFAASKARVGGDDPVAITNRRVELLVDPSPEQLARLFARER